MIPELGFFSLILATGLALLMAILPLVGSFNGNPWLMATSRPLAIGTFSLLAIGFACLAYSMVTDDFTVAYVAGNSNSALPVYYKFSAIWGGHEGSMYLWVWILSGWILALAIFSKGLPQQTLATVMGVLGIILLGFLLFVLLTSSPFERILPDAPQDGRDLNPLLQDIGLILHPPMLYMGYVGFSVAFAFAIAALITGKLDTAWARWARPWTNVAWIFLTLGIALGSWWAYYELGWGGWWFWDPVENASFMPWLAGTALMHSLAVTEKRGAFKSWTVLLAIFAFSFSLLGTFLVRSGVLTSVHAFASDPDRGYFILALLAITIGGSLVLFAMRAPSLKSYTYFGLLSRETFLFVNNILLTVAAFAVLVGTLLPLIFDAFNLGKISVGPPVFNLMFNILMVMLLICLGVGQLLKWKNDNLKTLRKPLLIGVAVVIAAALLLTFIYAGELSWKVTLGLSLALWIVYSTGVSLWHNTRHANSVIDGLKKLSLSYYGMLVAHFGLIITVIGVVMVSNYETEHDVRMSIGQQKEIAGYTFEFRGAREVMGPNFRAEQGQILVYNDQKLVTQLRPEKRFYLVSGNVMTEADIDAGLSKDLYVAMGEAIGEQGDWAIRIHVKPFVRWLWLGALIMSLGGLLAILDKRYRKLSRQDKEALEE